MSGKIEGRPFTVNIPPDLERRFQQKSHDTKIKRSDLTRLGIEIIVNMSNDELRNAKLN
jgi:hypothetical protein